MAKATLADATKRLGKIANEKEKDTGKVSITESNSTMMNTRVHKDLIKRMKRYCVEEEMTIQEFINKLIMEKMDSVGF